MKRHPMAVAFASGPLSHVPLDTALAERLRATYKLVRQNDLRFAELFYARLFAAAPQLRSMFPSDLQSQAAKLTAALDAVVQNFDDPRANIAALSDLGRRHAGYGVTPEHYRITIDLLVGAMRELGSTSIDEGRLNEWRSALRLISDQMIKAANST